jgi:hypothetical protein
MNRIVLLLILLATVALSGCASLTPAGNAGNGTAPVTVTLPLPSLPAQATHDISAVCTGISIAGTALSFAGDTGWVPTELMSQLNADFAEVTSITGPICSGDTTAVTDDIYNLVIGAATRARTDVAKAEGSKAAASSAKP